MPNILQFYVPNDNDDDSVDEDEDLYGDLDNHSEIYGFECCACLCAPCLINSFCCDCHGLLDDDDDLDDEFYDDSDDGRWWEDDYDDDYDDATDYS